MMNNRALRISIAIIFLLLMAGCGLKGNLFIPGAGLEPDEGGTGEQADAIPGNTAATSAVDAPIDADETDAEQDKSSPGKATEQLLEKSQEQ